MLAPLVFTIRGCQQYLLIQNYFFQDLGQFLRFHAWTSSNETASRSTYLAGLTSYCLTLIGNYIYAKHKHY